MDLVQAILKLKKEKDAVILAHYYQPGIIQELADFVGDSYYLSEIARDCTEKVIMFCGVRFMAESAKILSPHKTVLMPCPSAGCSMADMASGKALVELKKGHFKQIVFCKNPAEYGDDQIGYLSGDKESKLSNHMEVMRGIFLDFMSPAKLKAEEGRGRIKFTIPNFIAGATLYNTCFIFLINANSITPF